MSKQQTSSTLTKEGLFYMVLLSLQFGFQPILSKKYISSNVNKSTVIIMQEIIKFNLGLCMLLLNGQFKSAIKGWTIQSWIKVAFIPALLYSIQNMSSLLAYQNLDPLTYNILNQTKTLSAALCCYIVLGRKQSILQVLSLCILLISALIIENVFTLDKIRSGFSISTISSLVNWNDAGSTGLSRHVTHGVAPVLLASFISGLAGAISQKTLQYQSSTSKQQPRNSYFFSMELCIASLIFLSINIYRSNNDTTMNLTQGWEITTFIPIILNAIGGLLVGLVTKYAGSVRKGFSLIFGIFISGIVVQFVASNDAGRGISNEQITGGVLAAFSLWLHSSFPYKEKKFMVDDVSKKGDSSNGIKEVNGHVDKKKKKKSVKED